MKKWTTDQQRVIDERAGNLIVSASAGAGKTSVMIERIAQMITDGARFDEFLVMTFTNESARDMRRKLFERLPNNAVEIAQMSVGTFHKFCGDMVMTYFALVGINPAYAILDEGPAKIMKNEIMDALLNENVDKCGNAIDAFCGAFNNGLASIIFNLADFLDIQPDPEKWLETTALYCFESDLQKNRANKIIAEYYRNAGEWFAEKFDPKSDCFTWTTRLKSVRGYADMHQIALDFVKLAPMKRENPAYDAKAELNEVLKKIRNQYALPAESIIKNQTTDRELVTQVIELTREFMRRYDNAKRERNYLDFADLEKFTIKILFDPETQKRINEKYKYIFVDEYQDTNPVQEQILELLGASIFTVGDVKQSIYSFRGTNCELFTARTKRDPAIYLNKNFRSRDGILRFVNGVFSNIMPDYDKTSRFEVANGNTDGVGVITIDGGNAEIESAIIAQKIVELNRPFGEIAILARTSTHFPELMAMLKRVGIKCITDKKCPATDLPEIALLNAVLQCAHDPKYELPRALLMQSVIFNFTPNDLAKIRLNKIDPELKNRIEKFDAFVSKYNALCKTDTVANVLSTFIAEYHVLDFVPSANVYTFLNKLRNSTYASTVSQYVYMLENDLLDIEIDTSSTGDAVRIMTIHSAKGLEFPTVFLYNAGAKFSSADKRKLIMVDRELGLCVYSTDENENVKHQSIARLGSVISNDKIQIEEEKRLLYVALTRAKEQLFIIGSGGEYVETYAPKSYLDFIRPTDTIPAVEIEIIEPAPTKRPKLPKPDRELVKKLRARFDNKYKFDTNVTQKTSVTALTAKSGSNPPAPPKKTSVENSGTEYGTKFHRAMETQKPFDPATERALEIITEFTRDMTVYRELAVLETTEINGETVLVQGVIDLLALSKNRAVIIDYKTNKMPEQKLVETYRGQISMYAKSVEHSIGITPEMYLYSTFLEKLIKL